MANLDKNYIFYDLETTGQNPCFDQAVRFAAVETDADLKIISSKAKKYSSIFSWEKCTEETLNLYKKLRF